MAELGTSLYVGLVDQKQSYINCCYAVDKYCRVSQTYQLSLDIQSGSAVYPRYNYCRVVVLVIGDY